ncbi:unnamed protein product [Lymnaea stagnalis]|uniref:Antistasin-like domain-containing protein n=1 Tax=Lymnaea stagnalis TaxID=6523 RepID=A0AAV2IHL7_LYMST
MKIFLAALLLTLAAASPAVLDLGMIGICVEECSTGSHAGGVSLGCPAGYVCRSNGCGHTCQATVALDKRQRCPMMKCMPCAGGYVIDEHGCQTCTCMDEERALNLCPLVMCAMFCDNGFAIGANGCPLCSCAGALIV